MTRSLLLLSVLAAATACEDPIDYPVRGAHGGGGGEGGGDGGVSDASLVAPAIAPACTTDAVLPGSGVGRLAVPAGSDIVPLCDGLVAIGDRTSNRISVRWVRTGAEVAGHALTAAPGDLELDGARGLLFATLTGRDGLARVDLAQGGTPTVVELPDEALDLAIADDGELFVALAESDSGVTRPVVHLDGVGGAILGTADVDDRAYYIVWDSAGSQLIGGTQGLSPSGLRRYAFDDAGETLTLTQELWNAGSNGQDLAISPDGTRLAFSAGSGNGAGYTITDYSSRDLASSAGEWDTGAYPSSAAFSPDGAYLAATNSRELIVFDVATHRELVRREVDFGDCDYSSLRRIEWSRGGRYVFGFSDCGFDDDSGLVVWMGFAPPSPN